ncbi:MAG: division/cell wall cluster transcriptional repressor MraZ [Acidimicrobiales bacterium]
MARFFGTYEHTLDSKGRVILPARFRAHFEHGGYLTQNHDGCLALWTPEQFERQMQEKEEREATSRGDRNQARLWASTSHEVEIDRQGRMALPARLREFAGLRGDVLVTGIINRVELWDPARWQEKVGPEEQRLTEGLDN